ncbi:hypothetical protein [Aquimarina algiphila]|uniref:hypothetical protein n=1 Tax=Aquimarina algiphila TaxID=2047982 RepID=UPI0024919CC4|nr:hypothetical protein [Aquimarina algiphila]
MIATWQTIDELDNQFTDPEIRNRANEMRNEGVNVSQPDVNLSEFKVYQRQVSNNLSTSVSVSPYFKGDGSYEDLEFRYFVGAFSDVFRTTQGSGSSIIAERFGLGIQINLEVTGIKSSINLGFGMIAAAVEMDLAEANYSYQIYALPGGEFHSTLPKVGEFNKQSIKQFQKLVNKLKTLYSSNFESLELAAIEVLVANSLQEEGTENAHSYYFAARRVIEEKSLREAINIARIKSEDYNEDAIQYIYSRVGVSSLDQKPSSSSISKAKKIILE